MDTPSTPKKANVDYVAASPSSKATLEYNYWEERKRKVPKCLEGDLELCRLNELGVSRTTAKTVRGKCVGTFGTSSLFKVAFQDVTGLIVGVAFGEKKAARLREMIKLEHWYMLSKFEVRKENPEYLSGAVNDLQMIIDPDVCSIKDDGLTDAIALSLRNLEEVKLLADNSLVDVLAVCAKDWGQSVSSNGTKRLQVTMTDITKVCIRLTIWGEVGTQFLGSDGKVLVVRNASVTSYNGMKFLQTKWFTNIELEPDMEEATNLKKWFVSQDDD